MVYEKNRVQTFQNINTSNKISFITTQQSVQQTPEQ